MSLPARSSQPKPVPRIGAIPARVVTIGSLALLTLGLGILLIDSGSADLAYASLSFLLMIAGSLGLFAGALLALYSYYQTQRLARVLASDKLLAHWTIDGKRWKRYIAGERARANRDMLIFTLVLVGLVLAVEVLPSVFNRAETASHPARWSAGIVAGAWLIGLNTLYWAAHQARLFVLGRRTDPAIYITTDGVVLDRQWHTWRRFGRWLERVTYQARPDKLLIFTYHKRSARPTASEVKLYVPVPDSHVQEAKRLVVRFKGD